MFWEFISYLQTSSFDAEPKEDYVAETCPFDLELAACPEC
jgi:hypothetical protein